MNKRIISEIKKLKKEQEKLERERKRKLKENKRFLQRVKQAKENGELKDVFIQKKTLSWRLKLIWIKIKLFFKIN